MQANFTGGWSPRFPMSRQRNNNNPMGNQAPMQPNFGRAVGAIGATSMPYAGGSSGMAGPANAAMGMSAMRQAPAMNPAQGGGYQPSGRNVLMGQPANANTAMRPLNMPGMQFDANRNAMVREQRPQLTVNPDQNRWGNLSGGTLTRTPEQRYARQARLAGVRPQDMAQWRAARMNMVPGQQMAAGPANGTPAQMGAQMGAPAVPPQPPAAVAAVQPAPIQQPQRIQAIREEIDNMVSPVRNMYANVAPLVTTKPIESAGAAIAGNDEYYGSSGPEEWFIRNFYGRKRPEPAQQPAWRGR